MQIKTRKHTYKTGPNAGITFTIKTVSAYHGAYQIDYCQTLGRDSWGVSWGSTGIIEVDNEEVARTCALYVSKHTNGKITNMRELAEFCAKFRGLKK